jgi:bifunctional non-homologous end joining protein LigD
MANLGCIELNPWHSRVGSLENPDYLVIDLDPENVSFQRVIEAANAVRTTLEKAGAKSLCKTSGKRGLHVYVPLGARYNNDHARHAPSGMLDVSARVDPTAGLEIRIAAISERFSG